MGNDVVRQSRTKDKRSQLINAQNKYVAKQLSEMEQVSEETQTPGQASTDSICWRPDLLLEDQEDISKLKSYVYPFENLVLEGGGVKGVAYMGALRVLERVGILAGMRRFSGASTGAITAALLALGYTCDQLQQLSANTLSLVFTDHSLGYLSLLPGLLGGYGWNPGERCLKIFGEWIKAKTGDVDTTFIELYEQTGKELCIVVTNVNRLATEYCHPKTTPDMPVRLAVRMSISTSAVVVSQGSTDDLYIDGGILCNYPLHCYDGWWLSMEKEDSFMRILTAMPDMSKVCDTSERFGSHNDKTIGFYLYGSRDSSDDPFKDMLMDRDDAPQATRPDTRLARLRTSQMRAKARARATHEKIGKAVNKFLTVIAESNLDCNDVIDVTELQLAFSKTSQFSADDIVLLFGDNMTAEQAFECLDLNGDGKITYHELVHFVQRNGISLQSHFLGNPRREVNGLGDLLLTLKDMLAAHGRKLAGQPRDAARTVGINTDYLDTVDFDMQPDDVTFLINVKDEKEKEQSLQIRRAQG